MNYKRKFFISFFSLQWLEAGLVELFHSPMKNFFQKKRKNDWEVDQLAKFRNQAGCFLEFAVWPSTGGRKNLNVPAKVDKIGRLVFWI